MPKKAVTKEDAIRLIVSIRMVQVLVSRTPCDVQRLTLSSNTGIDCSNRSTELWKTTTRF